MSIELIAILMTAAFQSTLIIIALVMLRRIGKELDATIRAYGAGNLRTTRNLADDLRRVDEYVRTHGAEIDQFIADFNRQFPRSPA
jgi:hypothetical protein